MITINALPVGVISLLLGLTCGFLMHRSDFCIAGMFRDLFLFRQFFMIRMLAVAVLSSMMLFELARLAGLISIYPFPLIGSASLTNILGGFIFGMGMVLAGGCVVGTLYKMGSGSVLSFVAFIGLLVGSTVYVEIHSWWKSIATATTIVPGIITIPQLFDISPAIPVFLVLSLSLVWFFVKGRKLRWTRETVVEGYVQPWLSGLLLAVAGMISYVAVGMPLGITTSYAKMGAFFESLVFPEYVAAQPYFQALPLKYTPPVMDAEIWGGAGPAFDAISVVQYPVIAGIVLGAAFSAVKLGEYTFHWKIPCRQYVSALIGGLIMGLACRMSPACNVWHLLGGIPILALQSFLYLAGILPGAWLGGKLLTRFVFR